MYVVDRMRKSGRATNNRYVRAPRSGIYHTTYSTIEYCKYYISKYLPYTR